VVNVLRGNVHADGVKSSTEFLLLSRGQVFLRHSKRSKVDSSHLENRLLRVRVGEHLNPGLNYIDGLHLEFLGHRDVSSVPFIGGIQVVCEEIYSA